MRDFTTYEAEQFLRGTAKEGELSHSTLANIRNFLSGAFKCARRQGILNSPNPMRDVEIPRGKPPKETYAYSLEEEVRMLSVLPEPAATIVAAASFLGVRRGELRGLRWENYYRLGIRVMKSVWRSHVGEPKGVRSKGTIPVIPHLREYLDRHKAACGSPSHGYIFANAKGLPINLDTLAVGVIRPALDAAGLK